MNGFAPLLAEQTTNHYYRLARLAQLDEWWHWLALGAVAALIVVYVAWMYRRDGVELSRSKTILLALLRLSAFVGILVFFLQIERRADREVIRPSRVAALVDTSQSMGLSDPVEEGSTAKPSRSEQAIAAFQDGPLLAELRKKHEVVVYRFDAGAKPTEIAAFPRLAKATDASDPEADRVTRYLQTVSEARTFMRFAAAILAIAIFAGMLHIFTYRQSTRQPESWAQLIGMVALIVAAVLVAVANLRSPDVRWAVLLGVAEPSPEDVAKEARTEESSQESQPEPTINWSEELAPRPSGTETRLADALRYIIDKERGGSIAGIVLVTDGGQNAGVDAKVATVEAQDASIPIYAVGLGSDKLPRNVKVVDLEAPQRVYPGDEFNITAYIQGSELKDFTADVQLFTGPADAAADTLTEDASQKRSITLGDNSDVQSIVFKLKPAEQGRRQYQVRVTTKVKDQDARDNQRSATVEVVDRKNKVLLFAGGPTREFRFLRNQLYRDKDTVVDVLLQTGKPEVATEANKLIYEFPKNEDDLFGYDCIVAFDPDWEALDEVQVTLLERWVAEKAGGLIVVAGPVHTSTWAGRRRGDRRFDVIKSLYPVSFYTTGSSTLNLGRTGGEAAWPLQFTREGHEAEFLWLADDLVTSEAAWQSFDGVFGYFAVKDPKPGAKVFARFADPETSIDNELPIYMAGHFYGAGRVFFQASGEMWRLRAVDETYFETYYTKLLRWVSQGRLMQDSSRGILLVDKERCLLGEQVVIRAILTNAQRQPLTLPEVPLTLVQPDGQRKTLPLALVKESPRPGTYAGQFTAAKDGDYRLELRMPDAVDELLTRQVRADIPKREIEHPQRNDALLREITSKTDGDYYIGFDDATSGRLRPALANVIEPQDQKTIIPGTPDRDFDRRLMTWLMGLIVGVLCLEWLLRRLSKLA
jgi:hypothetical protein